QGGTEKPTLDPKQGHSTTPQETARSSLLRRNNAQRCKRSKTQHEVAAKPKPVADRRRIELDDSTENVDRGWTRAAAATPAIARRIRFNHTSIATATGPRIGRITFGTNVRCTTITRKRIADR